MQLIKPRILLGDDHGMIRRGISLLIKMDIGNCIIDEAESCSKIMSKLNQQYFTHLIIDIIFPDGSSLEILPNIRRLYPSLKIMVFSMQPQEVHGEALKQYNISYYLSKTTDDATVVKTLTSFLNNDKYEATTEPAVATNNPFQTLTARELQILHYIMNGLGTKQISDTLNLKMNSVSTLKKRIYEKTNTDNFKALLNLCTAYKINF